MMAGVQPSVQWKKQLKRSSLKSHTLQTFIAQLQRIESSKFCRRVPSSVDISAKVSLNESYNSNVLELKFQPAMKNQNLKLLSEILSSRKGSDINIMLKNNFKYEKDAGSTSDIQAHEHLTLYLHDLPRK